MLNYEAPQSHDIYLHRVGRTARAGAAGRACTLAAEPDRRVVKAAVRAGRAQGAHIVSRVVDPAAADGWAAKIEALSDEVEAVLEEEREQKLLGQAEVQVRRAENRVLHEEEILARPRRTWFESEREKRVARGVGRVELNGGEGGRGKGKGEGKGGKLSGKDRKRLDLRREREEGKVWKKGKGDGKGERGGKGKGKGQGQGAGGKAVKGAKVQKSRGKKR